MRVTILHALPAAILFLVAACNRGEPAADDGVAVMLGDGVADTAQPAPPFDDSNILAMLDRAHVTDSAAAALAITKASSADLRAFARQLMRDHHTLRAEGERVARRLRVTPTLPPGDQSAAHMEQTLRVLEGAERGRDFDKAYIDHEVAYHLDVLDLATVSMEMARASEVQAYIQQLAPVLLGHLDRARALQEALP